MDYYTKVWKTAGRFLNVNSKKDKNIAKNLDKFISEADKDGVFVKNWLPFEIKIVDL